jgi:molecular chaperone DnaJ
VWTRGSDFQRDGDDLVHVLRVSLAQAALGVRVDVPTLEGETELQVPAGSQPGAVFRVRGLGVPSLRGRARGDVLVHLEVEVPTTLSGEERELLERFAELRGESVAPADKGFFSRLRSASS